MTIFFSPSSCKVSLDALKLRIPSREVKDLLELKRKLTLLRATVTRDLKETGSPGSTEITFKVRSFRYPVALTRHKVSSGSALARH